ncbi:MAG: DsbA family protein [Deltaproteobacteria bacterium]|nr:DsbA family protein [Deltaproteobacteria bacterium]
MHTLLIRILASLIMCAAFFTSACDWNIPDYWADKHDVDPSGDADTDSDTDADTDTDADGDTDETDDAGTCEEDDTEGTCGEGDDIDAGVDASTGSDAGPSWIWDGSVGDYEDFCGNPKYAVFLGDDGREFKSEGVPHLGNAASAEVVIHGFSHFHCPHCRNAAEAFEKIFSDPIYAERAVYYFRHFYWYDDMLMDGWGAHKAAHAAHMQGRFWDMHDKIFDPQSNTEDDGLLTLASELGLDMSDFTADYGSSETEEYLLYDLAEGRDAGVTGTPTVFVNGYKLPYWPDIEELLACLFGYEPPPEE